MHQLTSVSDSDSVLCGHACTCVVLDHLSFEIFVGVAIASTVHAVDSCFCTKEPDLQDFRVFKNTICCPLVPVLSTVDHHCIQSSK